MTISQVQENNTSAGAASSITPTLLSNSTGGNLLLVSIGTSSLSNTLPTITPPAGWNLAVNAQNTGSGTSGQQAALYYFVDSTGGTTSVTFNFSSNCDSCAVIQEWAGLKATGVLDQTATNNTTGTTVTTGTTGVTTSANELAVWIALYHNTSAYGVSSILNGYAQDNIGTTTSPSGNSPVMNLVLFTQLLSATGATSSGCTLSGTPSGGGGTTTTALATFVAATGSSTAVTDSGNSTDVFGLSGSIVAPLSDTALGAQQLAIAISGLARSDSATGAQALAVFRDLLLSREEDMTDYYSNFATSTVAYGASGPGSQLLASDTQVTLQTGDGSKYPSVAPFAVVLGDAEIAKCTLRVSDTLTLIRGQENTSAQTWGIGTTVQHGATAASFTNIWSRMLQNSVNVQDYGAVGDGVTDDTTPIQNALNNCPTGGIVWFPATGSAYIISAALIVPSGVSLSAPNNTVTIKAKNGTNLSYMLTNYEYANNVANAGSKIRIRSLGLDGNKANNATGGDIIRFSTAGSYIEDCWIQNAPQSGIVLTDRTTNGSTLVTTACSENHIQNNKITACGKYGVRSDDYNHMVTDNWLTDNVVDTTSDIAIDLLRASGWFVLNNHVYGAQLGGITCSAAWNTVIMANEIADFGLSATASQTFDGLHVDVIDGRPVVVAGNFITSTEATNTSNYTYLNIKAVGGGGAQATAVVYGNHIYGNHTSAPTSLGIKLSSDSTQSGSGFPTKFSCFGNLVTGVATDSSIDSFTQQNMVAVRHYGGAQIDQHLIGGSSLTVTAAAGANAGASPPAPVVTAGSTDTRGSLTFGTGASPAAGAEAVVTFSSAGVAYASAPVVVIAAKNAATAALQPYVSAISASSFTVSFGSAPAASQANTTYSIAYFVIG